MNTTKTVDSADLSDAISTALKDAGITDEHGVGLDQAQRAEIAQTIHAEFEKRGYVVSENVEQPSYENGFLIPGRTCTCDVDHRCDAHDVEAEQKYWLGQLATVPVAVFDQSLAYEPGDPKAFEMDRVGS